MYDEDLKYIEKNYEKAFNKINKLWTNIEQDIPNIIYHYTSINSLKLILENESFFMTGCEFLNDSKEIIYLKEIINNVLENGKNIHPKLNDENFKTQFIDIINHYFDSFANTLLPNIFITSFSEEDHSLGIWSSYTQDDGYRMKFNYKLINKYLINAAHHQLYDINNNKTKINSEIRGLRVVYNYKTQYKFVRNLIKILAEIIYNFGGVRFCDDDGKNYDDLNNINQNNISIVFSALFDFALICKDPSFEYEKEFRIIKKLNHTTNERSRFEKYRVDKSMIIPYINLDFSIYKNKMPINEIQIGPKVNIDNAQKGIERYLCFSKYYNVKVSKSKIPIRF